MRACVLIVEDDQWMGECYQTWLRRAGHRVVWVRGAQEALDVLAEQTVQVLLLDLFLPTANGVQLLHMLATRLQTPSPQVIICSTSAPAVDWQGYGVRAVLDKTTLTPAKLRLAVQEAVHAGSLAH